MTTNPGTTGPGTTGPGTPGAERREERTVWEGHPSAILLAPVLLFCTLLALAVLWAGLLLALSLYAALAIALLPLLWAAYLWIRNATERYRITSERLVLRSGILSKRTEETELYRVTDYRMVEPFAQRIFGLGELELATSDEAHPVVRLRGVRGPAALRDELRVHVEACRDRKRVRVTELE
jgi:uncharacterized membrane protein YdbT with pleckstrin-like domain